MALGTHRDGKQHELWVSRDSLNRAPSHVFYDKLNELLRSIDFDESAEQLCAPYYSNGGRPSIPPGIYFRMTLIGYFEGIDSQRGIAWRCQDSLSLPRQLIPATISRPCSRRGHPRALLDEQHSPTPAARRASSDL